MKNLVELMNDDNRSLLGGRLACALRRWPAAFVVAGLVLLPLLVFAPLVLLRDTFYFHDVQHYFYPYHTLAAALVAQRQLPLWNAYAFSGIPLLGDGQTALFYPPNWLFFGLPGAAALNYAVLLQFCIAGLGMYLFMRSLDLWRFPALVAAVAYMFCGFMTARVVHLSIMSGAALIPLLFACVERTLRTGSARWFAAAALAAALQALAGHPQVPIYTALALGLYVLVRAVERGVARGDWRALVRFPLLLAGIYALGYCLAAVQLLPWVELASLSPRAAGASFAFVFGGSMNGDQWLLFLFPYLYGSLEPGRYATLPMDIVSAVKTWEHSAYVGILPLALAALALLDLARFPHAAETRRHGDTETQRHGDTETRSQGDTEPRRHGAKETRSVTISLSPDLLVSRPPDPWFSLCYFALLLLLGLLMAAGKYTPFAELIYATPVIGKLRDVERAVVLAAFALTALAAFGMQRLLEPGDWAQTRRRSRGLHAAALIGLLPLGVVLLVGQPAFRAALGLDLHALEQLQLSRPNAYIPVLLGGASAALLIGWRRWPALAPVLALALVVLDLGSYAAAFNPTTDAQLYSRVPPVVQFLRQDSGPFRKATFLTNNALDSHTAQDVLAVSWGMVYGIEDINGFNSLQPRRYTDYLFGPNVDDVSYGYLTNEQLFQPTSPILSTLNVKYLLVPGVLQPQIGPTFREVYADAQVRVYQNMQVYPRAYFVDAVRSEADPRVVLRSVTAGGFDGRRLALVEAGQLPSLGTASDPAEVTITRYAADEISLTTSTAAQRFLVLSEMYFPGWHAYVDGVETPIYRTNYIFRGVVVPAGRHTLTFVYRPASALWGAALSALALVVVVGLLVVRRS